MKLRYDPSVDALYIHLTQQPISRTERPSEQCALDFDAQGKLVGIEILNVQRDGIDPMSVALQFASPAEEAQRPDTEAIRAGRKQRMQARKRARQAESPT
ncbi:MAG: DUF2283 domain-containing protein [Anaerolineae bacterium]|nr:DUF2283 domain-containing protein [Anaerolineae bacterium]